MREIKLKYLCHSNATPYSIKDLDEENTGYPVFGAAGIMGYLDTYNYTDEYLGVIKDGAGVGRVDKYPAKSSLLGTMTGIIPNDGVCIDWLKYIIENLNLGNSIDKTTIPHIYFNEYGNKVVPFISVDGQSRVSDYLDKKCAEIDVLIAAKEKTNALLKEHRQSIIYEAVTKGLDPNAPMKGSGIKWIGKIPEGWNVWRMKHLAKTPLQYGANATGIEFDFDLPRYVRITDITVDGHLTSSDKQSLPLDIGEEYLLEDGDILFARSGATAGKSFIYSNEYGKCCFAGYLIRLQVDKSKASSKFIYYYTLTQAYEKWAQQIFIQATIQNISAEKYNNLQFAVPSSLDEQEAIVNYLDTKCAEINAVIHANELTIEKLKEYRQSVIYEAVTGKV